MHFTDGDGVSSSSTTLAANPYRFKGIVPITISGGTVTGGNDPLPVSYRTYFAMDPNYNADVSPVFELPTTFTTFNASGENLEYCLENTFDVAHQNVNNTTCLIIKTTFDPSEITEFNGSKTFYTLNGSTDAIYSKASVDEAVYDKVIDMFETSIKSYVSTEYNPSEQLTLSLSSVTYSNDAVAGNVDINDVTIKATGTSESYEFNLSTAVEGSLTSLNANMSITRYLNGEAYYTVLIKHFGDDLTPWNPSNKSVSYPNNTNQAAANWLGRYGVLRNNWYNIDVTGLTNIGSATIPTVNVDPTPDDNLKSYISVSINVLSWAKRTQSTVLQ
ncbi:MAG: Mfa1 fimbrilin C-terminal domain-containing protein [Prevotellaceae bacterium]|nr:Mfa1 fimbrilin C-terminal domain-containing protein [Prevotellaceae bacterium]